MYSIKKIKFRYWHGVFILGALVSVWQGVGFSTPCHILTKMNANPYFIVLLFNYFNFDQLLQILDEFIISDFNSNSPAFGIHLRLSEFRFNRFMNFAF